MVYLWDNKNRNDTFRLCIDAINKAKGLDIKFDFVETGARTISVHIVYKKYDKFTQTYYFDDLAKVTGKMPDSNTNTFNFNELTEKQYIRLCKEIIDILWETLSIFIKNL